MTYTWDGQPAADIDAAWQAMLAAAWEAGRDAAASEVMCGCTEGHEGQCSDWHKGYGLCGRLQAEAIEALTPPPDLAAALAKHTKRAVASEREKYAQMLDSVLRSLEIHGRYDRANAPADSLIGDAAALIARARGKP